LFGSVMTIAHDFSLSPADLSFQSDHRPAIVIICAEGVINLC
jgi:hypothetical protein